MFAPTPTQSIPGGFLLVFLGLLAWAWAALAGYAGWLMYDKEVIQHKITGLRYGMMFMGSAGGLVVGLALIALGLCLAFSVPPYDTRDPKQPNLKW